MALKLLELFNNGGKKYKNTIPLKAKIFLIPKTNVLKNPIA